MGHNTTILVLNDTLDKIRDDPEFGKKLYDAISRLSGNGGKEVQVGEHGAWAVESHHMDSVIPVMVGANAAVVIRDVWAYRSKDPETDILYALARKLKYRISKQR
jgi:hypothetical protein